MKTIAAVCVLMALEAGSAGAVDIKGLEYFTRWHFSIAAHSGLGSLRWTHSVERQTVPGSEVRIIRNSAVAEIGLSPVLFIRGYF